jgi:DNA polymerase III delta subunit
MGNNTFENERSLARLIEDSLVSPEKIDGTELELKQLPDLLMGGTLFATKRLVIIKNLSENKPLWTVFDSWIGRVSTDTHLVLMDKKPDKRSKTFKALQKNSTIHESVLWTEHDKTEAEQWVMKEAASLGLELNKKSAHFLVDRVGVDQWELQHALEKLALANNGTPQKIEEITEANPVENVFHVFDAMLKKDVLKANNMLGILKLSEDPYRLLGLLNTQAVQFATFAISGKASSEVAKELAISPFVLSKFTPYLKQYDRRKLREMITTLARADEIMKTSATDPWLCVEKTVLAICSLK